MFSSKVLEPHQLPPLPERKRDLPLFGGKHHGIFGTTDFQEIDVEINSVLTMSPQPTPQFKGLIGDMAYIRKHLAWTSHGMEPAVLGSGRE